MHFASEPCGTDLFYAQRRLCDVFGEQARCLDQEHPGDDGVVGEVPLEHAQARVEPEFGLGNSGWGIDVDLDEGTIDFVLQRLVLNLAGVSSAGCHSRTSRSTVYPDR